MGLCPSAHALRTYQGFKILKYKTYYKSNFLDLLQLF